MSELRTCPPPKNRWVHHALLGLTSFLLLTGMVYGVVAGLIFDFSQTAHPPDEENTANGTPVAVGPLPRDWACKPTYEGLFFDGREWPFRLFQPVCSAWLGLRGYAPPREQRSAP